MAGGVVKWFNAENGFGLIAKDGGTDAFAHRSDIADSGCRELVEGEEVEGHLRRDPGAEEATGREHRPRLK
ncbi:CspA family cold shock protein [Streptomyces griseochromogenes]|uniref:CspA family cold shock protein n=1 Tax=Streptomyces griseochromogenes TaxID=68214 RepID=A0ABS4M3E0_9ACTN|nr:CspA family cold shock protein [Streptomyces griseochromogenes]